MLGRELRGRMNNRGVGPIVVQLRVLLLVCDSYKLSKNEVMRVCSFHTFFGAHYSAARPCGVTRKATKRHLSDVSRTLRLTVARCWHRLGPRALPARVIKTHFFVVFLMDVHIRYILLV